MMTYAEAKKKFTDYKFALLKEGAMYTGDIIDITPYVIKDSVTINESAMNDSGTSTVNTCSLSLINKGTELDKLIKNGKYELVIYKANYLMGEVLEIQGVPDYYLEPFTSMEEVQGHKLYIAEHDGGEDIGVIPGAMFNIFQPPKVWGGPYDNFFYVSLYDKKWELINWKYYQVFPRRANLMNITITTQPSGSSGPIVTPTITGVSHTKMHLKENPLIIYFRGKVDLNHDFNFSKKFETETIQIHSDDLLGGLPPAKELLVFPRAGRFTPMRTKYSSNSVDYPVKEYINDFIEFLTGRRLNIIDNTTIDTNTHYSHDRTIRVEAGGSLRAAIDDFLFFSGRCISAREDKLYINYIACNSCDYLPVAEKEIEKDFSYTRKENKTSLVEYQEIELVPETEVKKYKNEDGNVSTAIVTSENYLDHGKNLTIKNSLEKKEVYKEDEIELIVYGNFYVEGKHYIHAIAEHRILKFVIENSEENDNLAADPYNLPTFLKRKAKVYYYYQTVTSDQDGDFDQPGTFESENGIILHRDNSTNIGIYMTVEEYSRATGILLETHSSLYFLNFDVEHIQMSNDMFKYPFFYNPKKKELDEKYRTGLDSYFLRESHVSSGNRVWLQSLRFEVQSGARIIERDKQDAQGETVPPRRIPVSNGSSSFLQKKSYPSIYTDNVIYQDDNNFVAEIFPEKIIELLEKKSKMVLKFSSKKKLELLAKVELQVGAPYIRGLIIKRKTIIGKALTMYEYEMWLDRPPGKETETKTRFLFSMPDNLGNDLNGVPEGVDEAMRDYDLFALPAVYGCAENLHAKTTEQIRRKTNLIFGTYAEWQRYNSNFLFSKVGKFNGYHCVMGLYYYLPPGEQENYKKALGLLWLWRGGQGTWLEFFQPGNDAGGLSFLKCHHIAYKADGNVYSSSLPGSLEYRFSDRWSLSRLWSEEGGFTTLDFSPDDGWWGLNTGDPPYNRLNGDSPGPGPAFLSQERKTFGAGNYNGYDSKFDRVFAGENDLFEGMVRAFIFTPKEKGV